MKSRWQPTQSPIQWACMPFIPYQSGRSANASRMACGNKKRSEKQQCKAHVRTSGVGLEVGKVETRTKVLDIRLPRSRASVGVAKDNRGAQFTNHLLGLTLSLFKVQGSMEERKLKWTKTPIHIIAECVYSILSLSLPGSKGVHSLQMSSTALPIGVPNCTEYSS